MPAFLYRQNRKDLVLLNWQVGHTGREAVATRAAATGLRCLVPDDCIRQAVVGVPTAVGGSWRCVRRVVPTRGSNGEVRPGYLSAPKACIHQASRNHFRL